jgi:hypothetical protein
VTGSGLWSQASGTLAARQSAAQSSAVTKKIKPKYSEKYVFKKNDECKYPIESCHFLYRFMICIE